ncbi:MAG: hypothetical protein ACRC0R_05255 [Cetobacterium sp.]
MNLGPVDYLNKMDELITSLNNKTFDYLHEIERDDNPTLQKELKAHLCKRRKYKNEVKFLRDNWDLLHKVLQFHHKLQYFIKGVENYDNSQL